MWNKLHLAFQNLIAYLTYEKNWVWLDMVICLLCEVEMYLKVALDSEFKERLDTCDIGGNGSTDALDSIPKNSFYCQGCPFYNVSKIASFFYGKQMDGYCYYLGKGDFTFFHGTMLLWDGCKECGINEFDEDTEET